MIKKAKGLLLLCACTRYAKNIWCFFVNYTMQVLTGSGSPTEFPKQWFLTRPVRVINISEYARAKKNSRESYRCTTSHSAAFRLLLSSLELSFSDEKWQFAMYSLKRDIHKIQICFFLRKHALTRYMNLATAFNHLTPWQSFTSLAKLEVNKKLISACWNCARIQKKGKQCYNISGVYRICWPR